MSEPFPILLWSGELQFHDKNLYVLNLAQALKQKGFPVQLCTPGGPMVPEFERQGIEVLQKSFLRFPIDFFRMSQLVHQLKDLSPKLIHLQSASQFGPALRAAKKLQIPLVLTVYNLDEIELDPHLFDKWLVGILALSEEVRENLVNRHKVPKRLISVLFPATNWENVESVRQYERNLRPVVGTFCSRAEEGELFVRTAHQIVQRGHDAEFLIAGQVEGRRKLEKLAEELGILERLTFCETLTHSGNFLKMLHIYVGLQGKRQFGQDLLEAMAWGKPVVALRRGVNFSLIQEEETGYLVPPQDEEGLAERVSDLLQMPERAEEMGQKAKEHVQKHHNLRLFAEELGHFYQKALASREDSL